MATTYIVPSTSFPGESTDARSPQGTEIQSADWGVGRLLDPATGLPMGQPVGNLFKLTFAFRNGVASGHLGRLLVSGTRLSSLELVGYVDGAATPFHRLLLTDAGVEGVQASAYSGANSPMETWSFSYRKARMTYTPINSDGTLGTPVAAEFAIPNF